MKLLTRYILKELTGPTLLGFLFYTFIIMMRQLFDMAGLIIRRSLPGSTVAHLLWLSLPNIIVLTVPMSLLFGTLIAFGRLSADSEIIAMRASGIAAQTVFRPVFVFSFIAFLLNFYLMNVLLPRGNSELQKLRVELFTSGIETELKPRLFYDEYENLIIYIDDVDRRTGQWKGVFVADSRDEAKEQPPLTTPQQVRQSQAPAAASQMAFAAQRGGQKVIVAQSGNLSIVNPGKQIWLNLRKAESHVWDPRKPDRYDYNHNDVQRLRLPSRDTATGLDPSKSYIRSFREMDLKELFEQVRLLRNTPDREAYWAAKVQIHKMFVFPFACIVFGVLGLPLGITNRRGGKSSGFSLSIGIILVYYVMNNNGEHLAVTGKVSPAVAMWAPNVLLLAIGLYLLNRVNRDVGAQRTDTGLWRRLLQKIPRRTRAAAPAGAEVAVEVENDEPMLKRLEITFPNILDRYILREFLKILALVLISTAALFVIVDYTDLSGDIRQNHIPLPVVFAYYRFTIFQILNWTLPISVLVATLVTFGILSKNNEITALKSSGMSLYRVALPVMAIAGAISVLAYLMLDYVLPYSNRRVDELRNRIKGKKAVLSQNQQKLWFLGKGRYIINFLNYDREAKQLSQVQVFEFHPAVFRLTRRVYADRARWDGEGWVFEHGWMRSFSDDGSTSTYSPIVRPLRLFYAEKPEDFATEVKSPDQMTFAQLRRYIDTIKRSGYAAEELTVKLYEKTSWPFISMVMALIALPFAFRIGRRGALYGIGIALVVGIFYWMIFAVFTKFGEVGNLPPPLAAWAANVLFAIIGIYLFLHVET
jgi:LPS export ABC transporter permease LptG/LPS export ABC transporter permease LptF